MLRLAVASVLALAPAVSLAAAPGGAAARFLQPKDGGPAPWRPGP